MYVREHFPKTNYFYRFAENNKIVSPVEKLISTSKENFEQVVILTKLRQLVSTRVVEGTGRKGGVGRLKDWRARPST